MMQRTTYKRNSPASSGQLLHSYPFHLARTQVPFNAETPILEKSVQNARKTVSTNSYSFILPGNTGSSESSSESSDAQFEELKESIRLERKLQSTVLLYRSASHNFGPLCNWNGKLKNQPVILTEPLSTKIFLGGLPIDCTEKIIFRTLCNYNPILVDWPGRSKDKRIPKGFAYVVFETEEDLKKLLKVCYDKDNGMFILKMRIKFEDKIVEMIPWMLSDSCYRIPRNISFSTTSRTVFVGGLHGTLKAESLAKIFNDIFSGVIRATIDTDKYKYPIGSGRIYFDSNCSYMKAVATAFVQINTNKFNCRVQIEPLLEECLCSECKIKSGPYFCRNVSCFKYYCHHCWYTVHASDTTDHIPLNRKLK